MSDKEDLGIQINAISFMAGFAAGFYVALMVAMVIVWLTNTGII